MTRLGTILVLALVAGAVVRPAPAQGSLVLRGGWLFDSVGDERVPNTGIVVVGGRILEVGADLEGRDLSGVEVVELDGDATVIPGLFDLHAHHGMSLFGRGRVDETEYYPRIFLANGVTTVFPAGEMNPDRMRETRLRIDSGELPGPRMLNSGPYFGTARPGWNRRMTEQEVRAEVDRLAASGVRGFKAKGIGAEHLRILIEQAHRHGLTVTGHLGSGFRGSVNPRDAILMGIDRVEHFLGGDALTDDKSAYASLVDVEPDTPEFERIVDLYIRHGVYFDATLSAYGYFGERDPEVFTYWVDEREFFTRWFRQQKRERGPRRVSEQFERIYRVKRKTVKAFFDAGGGDLITLGTDHPSDGDYLSGFAVHRELLSLALSGIPTAAVLKIATINGARAMGLGDRLGTIETGKLADLVVVAGDPLGDIRAARDVRLVVRSGIAYEPRRLLDGIAGKIGPNGPDEVGAWLGRSRR